MREGNQAASLFTSFFMAADLEGEGSFTPCAEVEEALYCAKSGLLAGDNCPDIEVGYYSADNMPAVCGIH